MTRETSGGATPQEWPHPEHSVRGVRSAAAPRRFEYRVAGGRYARVAVRYAPAAELDPAPILRNRRCPGIGADVRPDPAAGERSMPSGNVQVKVTSNIGTVVRRTVLPGSELQTFVRSATLVPNRVKWSVFRCGRCGEFEREVEVTGPIIRSGPVTVVAVRGPWMRWSGGPSGRGAGSVVPAGADSGVARNRAGFENSLTLRDCVVRRKGRLPVTGWLREFERNGMVIARPVDPARGLANFPMLGNPAEKWFRCWDGKMVLVAASCVREFDCDSHGSFTRTTPAGKGFRVAAIGSSPQVRDTERVLHRMRIPRKRPVPRG